MSLQLWLQNLLAYSFQITLLVIAGSVLSFAFRVRTPSAMLAYRQILLAACLLMPLIQPWKHVAPEPAAAVIETVEVTIAHSAGAARGRDVFSDFPLHQTTAVILVTGVLFRLLWLLAGLCRLRRYRRNASPLAVLPAAVAEMQRRIGARARIYVSNEIDSPVTFGAIKPIILLPERFPGLDTAFQRAIACHEFLHVRRLDWAFTVLEEVICALFWFHPAVWWLVRQIQLNREQVVDRQVLHLTRAQNEYIQSLLQMAKTRGRAAIVPAPLFLREHQLTQRVALMQREVSMSRRRLLVSFLAIFALLFLT